jgi:predicted ATPase
MAKIEGFRLRNFGALRDVTLGKLWNQSAAPLTPLTAVIGKNGTGKTTLFDSFGFLAECLKEGVEQACDNRGGFERVRSQGENGPIEFEVYYRESSGSRPITYEVAFDLDKSGRPYVKSERLRQRREGQRHGWPFSFLILEAGKGVVWGGEQEGIPEDDNFNLLSLPDEPEELSERVNVELEDYRKLGISALGALKQHPRISAFRKFIEGWYLSYFTPDAARSLPKAGPQKHLNIHGDNIGNVVQFMQRDHKNRFKKTLEDIAAKIPGVDKIEAEPMPNDTLLLKFNDKGFHAPFTVRQMSDGTLKIFAYLLLLSDPNPHPFLCIEEPENGLYHKLLETLVQEFRDHTNKGSSQIFVTTHQPYFVDALEPNELWILEKSEDGFSTVRRASEKSIISTLVEEGLPLGGLWYSDYLEGDGSNSNDH